MRLGDRLVAAVGLIFLNAAWVSVPAAAQNPAPPPTPPPAASAAMRVEGLNVYPKNGQTRDQEWADRYECDRWSKGQSGYDPALPGGGVSSNETASRHDQYRGALSACLQSHGYTVTTAPPPPVITAAPPPPPRIIAASSMAPTFKYHPFAWQIEGGYTIAQGDSSKTLNDGYNTGLGLTWYPSSTMPLAFRIDGTYSNFQENSRSLSLASQNLGTFITNGYEELYGGDVDAEFDLHTGSRAKEYIFGGIGRYRERTTFQQSVYARGVGCFYRCYIGYFPFDYTVARDTTGWLNSWNAGIGIEFAMANRTSFFVEARYQRIAPNDKMLGFVPIRVGLRF
jgi:opacity protein-like surface antigen